jgi:hypothetical protein
VRGGGEGKERKIGQRKISIFGFGDFWLNKKMCGKIFIYGF